MERERQDWYSDYKIWKIKHQFKNSESWVWQTDRIFLISLGNKCLRQSINCTNRILAINVIFVKMFMKVAKGRPRFFIIVLVRWKQKSVSLKREDKILLMDLLPNKVFPKLNLCENFRIKLFEQNSRVRVTWLKVNGFESMFL